MTKQTNKPTKIKGEAPRKKFYLYDVEVEENGQKVRELQVTVKKQKEDEKCKFITTCPFHLNALNDLLKNKKVGFGERFYWVHRFFKYSIED